MSSIRTPQRRALEKLSGGSPENTISVDTGVFYLEGTRIFLLGVSRGIGTCADLRGVNIAVFSSGGMPTNLRGPVHELCACLALLRTPTGEEKAVQRYPNLAYMTVERLEIAEELSDCEHAAGIERAVCRHLVKTGAKTVYVNTI